MVIVDKDDGETVTFESADGYTVSREHVGVLTVLKGDKNVAAFNHWSSAIICSEEKSLRV